MKLLLHREDGFASGRVAVSLCSAAGFPGVLSVGTPRGGCWRAGPSAAGGHVRADKDGAIGNLDLKPRL